MAKKKRKAKSAPKKKDNTLLYGIGVVILIIIIIILVRGGKKPVEPANVEVTPPEAPVEEPTANAFEGVTEELSCDVGAAIGYKACNALGNGNVELVVLHQGQDTLTGAHYRLLDENGDLVAEASQLGNVEGGAEATYTLPISEYPDTKKVEIRPVIQDEGVDKICVNQRVVVIPKTSCK